MSYSTQNIRIVGDNNDVLPFRPFRDESSVKIFIARDMPEGDLGVYGISCLASKRAFLKSCFSDLKEFCLSYQTLGVKGFSIDLSLRTLGITVGIYLCYCFYILIENQAATLYYTIMPQLDSFDHVYSNFSHMNLSSDIIATNKIGNVISYLMVNNKNLMDDIHVLASYSIAGALPDQNLVYDINKKTSDLFLTYKYRFKTIFTRFCYAHEESGGYTVESHVFNKKIPLHQYETVFQQNCPGLAIIMAKWPINPFQLAYGISFDLHASFDINVIHPYQCLDEESDDMNFRTNRRLLQNQPSAVEKALQKVADDFKKIIDLHKVLQEIVTQLNNKTCPGTTLLYQFEKKVFPLRWVIQQLNTDYVRLKVWYGPNYSVRHVIAEPLTHAIKSSECDLESSHDLEGADVVIDFDASNPIRITTSSFMPTYTAEKMVTHSLIPTISQTKSFMPPNSLSQSALFTKSKNIALSATASDTVSESMSFSKSESVTLSTRATASDTVSESMSPSKSESVTLPVKWTADIPTEILSNVSYKWTEIIANGTAGSPSPRSGHVVGRLGDDEIFVGFGYSGSKDLSDIYAYNITSNQWRSIPSSLSKKYMPSSLTYNRTVWIFSGRSGGTNITQFVTTGYQTLETTGFSYTGLYNRGTMTAFGNDFYIFGGEDGSGYFSNKTYRLSNFSMLIDISPMLSPPSRCDMQFQAVREIAFIFGGYNGNYLNDLWQYNLTSYQWKQITPIVDPFYNKPSARSGYASAVMEGDVFIFSGSGGSNDLWRLDTKFMAWHLLIPKNQENSPAGRTYAGDLVRFGIDFYLFGGSNSTRFNDLWRLRQTTLTLISTEITPNSITAGQPFNLSWHVNTTSGAHNVTVMFDDQNCTQTFNTSTGWMMFNMSNILVYNFSLILMISDFFDHKATVRQVIPFYRM